MTNGNNAEALPKLLLDLIEQVDGRSEVQNEIKEENEIDKENIAHNLPKVNKYNIRERIKKLIN